MPGAMNGRQLVDEALKRRPSLKTLFTSGYTENAIVHHGRLDAGVLLLAKPYRKAGTGQDDPDGARQLSISPALIYREADASVMERSLEKSAHRYRRRPRRPRR